jgi:hypothetical protein
MKTKKSFFIFLITIMYFFGSFFIMTATADSLTLTVDYREHFEDDTLGGQASETAFGQAFMNTWSENGLGVVAASIFSPFGGVKAYDYTTSLNKDDYVNFTYNTSFHITWLNFTFTSKDMGASNPGSLYRYVKFMVDDGAGGTDTYFQFRYYQSTTPNKPRFQYYNTSTGWTTLTYVSTDQNDNSFSCYLHFISNDTYTFKWYHHNLDAWYYLNNTLTNGVSADQYPRLLYIVSYTEFGWDAQVDDFRVSFGYPEVGPGAGESTIYVKFVDPINGQYIDMFGYGYSGGVEDPFEGRAFLETDFTPYGYKYSDHWGYTLSITGTFTEGSYHYINFSGITVNYPDDVAVRMADKNSAYQIYDQQTITINFVELESFHGYNNSKKKELRDGLEVEVRTDKREYESGENVLIQYRLPTHLQLENAGYTQSGWQLWVYDDRDRFGWPVSFLETDAGASAAYKVVNLIYDNQFHSLSHTFPVTTDSAVQYKIYIGQAYFWAIDQFLLQDPLRFWVVPTGGTYTPDGNITSISPDPPRVGQTVSITINADNYGQLDYKRVESAEENRIQRFDKPTGSLVINTTFWEMGYYRISLKVSDGLELYEVNYTYVWVNDTGNASGGYGYNVEFLTAEPYRAIAGYDTVTIQYRTLVNNTKLKVTDSRGQRTLYSTSLDAGYGTHKITLPNWANIGRWNVTMEANETLYTDFYVIADENNFAEFSRNVYYDTEQFDVYLRHDKPVILLFKHDGDPVGAEMYIDSSQQVNGLITIDKYYADLAPGNWTLELYQSNDRIKKRLIAADYCTVLYNSEARKAQYQEEGYDSIIGMFAMLAPLFGGGEAGFWFLSLFCIIGSLILISVWGGKNIKPDSIFLILIIETLIFCMIGWLPFWVAIVAIVIAAFAIGPSFSKKLNLGST